MNRIVILSLFILIIFCRSLSYGNNPVWSESIASNIFTQDTLQINQLLYRGILWKNNYRRIQGDQFLFSDFFLPATVSVNGKTFKNLKIKYDILSDEIITTLNNEIIIQLNKEMVDSFSINFENKTFKFINIRGSILKGFKGYANILYNGRTTLFVNYKKNIRPAFTEYNDGEFYQIQQIYFIKDSILYHLDGKNDLLKVLNADKVQMKDFINRNKIKVSKKIPESFLPLIRYYDSLSQ